MAEKFMDFDPANYLETKDEVDFFISDALETGDANYIANAFGVARRQKA